MYFRDTHVDKVTPAQISEARKIIPGLKLKPVVTAHDAVRIAIRELTPTLHGRQHFSDSITVKTLRAGETINGYFHYCEPDETGWKVSLLVSGD